jgi:hypothetical protein
LFRHGEPNEPTKGEGPLHLYPISPHLPSVSTVSRGHTSLVITVGEVEVGEKKYPEIPVLTQTIRKMSNQWQLIKDFSCLMNTPFLLEDCPSSPPPIFPFLKALTGRFIKDWPARYLIICSDQEKQKGNERKIISQTVRHKK